MAKGISREGHRQRIRDSYIENGIEGMPPHNVLELILTYSIPRRDVKGIAYSLLNSFGGKLENVFNASLDELKAVSGVGDSSAVLIKLFSEASKRIESSAGELEFDNYLAEKEFAENKLKARNDECYLIVLYSNLKHVISSKIITANELKAEENVTKTIVDEIVKNNAAGAIIAHKYPEPSFVPRDADVERVNKLSAIIAPLKVRLYDYIIIGGDGTLSMVNDINYCLYFEESYIKIKNCEKPRKTERKYEL